MEKVSFTTYDGVELAANLYLPKAGKEWTRGVIVCPGFGSRKENHGDFGVSAAAAGVAALILDFRGHGESGGQVDANIFNDVAAALQYMQGRPEVNPAGIAIRGSSMGGWLAVHTAAHLLDLSPVIAICPGNELTLSALMDEVSMAQRGHHSPVVGENPPRVDVNSTLNLLYRLDSLQAARHISPRPLLLIHCEDDQVVPPHVSRRFYDSAKEPKQLWLLPGGDHNFAQHDPETTGRTLKWMATARSDGIDS